MYSVLTTYIEILCFIDFFLAIGDGKMDSPGFNANFCLYAVINNDNLEKLDMVVVDKREVGLKTTNLEKEGLIRGLEQIPKEGVNVVEVAHSQIKKKKDKYEINVASVEYLAVMLVLHIGQFLVSNSNLPGLTVIIMDITSGMKTILNIGLYMIFTVVSKLSTIYKSLSSLRY